MSTDHLEKRPRPWWLLLFPISYCLHIGEEWWGGEGFAAWTARTVGSPVSTTRFIILNSILWPLFTIASFYAILRPKLAWIPVTLATVVLINTVLHVVGTVATGAYSPGLVTALLLYLPTGIAALVHGSRIVAPRSFQFAILLGVVIHALVVVIAFA